MTRDSTLQRQVDMAMAKFDAHRTAFLASPEGARMKREARRDLLVERGLARASRTRYYERMYGNR